MTGKRGKNGGSTADLTIEILRSIRDEIRKTNVEVGELRGEVRKTNHEVDQLRGEVRETNGRLDQLRDELARRIVESEVRTATAITEMAGSIREMTALLRAAADLRPRLEKCEREIEDLKKQRVG